VIYQNAKTNSHEISIAQNLEVLNIKNNIIFTTPTRRTINLAVAQTGTVSINNNLQWRPDGNPNIIVAGANKTWAQWQALGYDVNGVNADPLFTNASSNDFTLQGASPAINAGANLSGSYQAALLPGSVWTASVLTGNQNLYGAGWEIGAYAYGSASPVSPVMGPAKSSGAATIP
jgi:hypothetical protein